MALNRFIDTLAFFPWWQPESTGGVCHFDVDSGSFMCDIGTFMWLSGTLMAFNTFLKENMTIATRLFVTE